MKTYDISFNAKSVQTNAFSDDNYNPKMLIDCEGLDQDDIEDILKQYYNVAGEDEFKRTIEKLFN